jgi:hypothetical protein
MKLNIGSQGIETLYILGRNARSAANNNTLI